MLKCFSHTRFLGQWEDNKMCEGIVILLNAIIIPQSLDSHTLKEMNSDFIFYMFSQEVWYEWFPLSFAETKKIRICHDRKENMIIIRFEYIILNIIRGIFIKSFLDTLTTRWYNIDGVHPAFWIRLRHYRLEDKCFLKKKGNDLSAFAKSFSILFDIHV